jgi:ketosteroid isomerase-like protein
MRAKIDIVRDYFRLLEIFVTEPAAFESLLHPALEQTEFPNLLNRKGQHSGLTDMIRRAAAGKAMLASQSFEIKNSVEGGDQLVVEALWRGRMAVDAGPLKAQQELRAHFCIVLEFQDGRIVRQRNYDCFEDFS